MANIKFSQFTVGNTESDIDFVVGYKGANNIQISPANLLSATLSGYLPLTGGTMSGSVIFSDGVYAYFGGASDLGIVHSGADSLIINETGDLYIRNKADDKDIIFQSDDGSGGTTTYFKLDGSSSNLQYFKDLLIADNVSLLIGNSSDLIITHNGSSSFIHNVFGDLIIKNSANDKDIIFQSDDGSGGIATYMIIDGGTTQTKFEKNTKHIDSVKAIFGASNDLQIYSDGTNSYINNFVGELNVWQNANDKDIVFASDNGSGGIIEYLRLDGSDERLTVNAPNGMLFFDNITAKFGTSSDLQIFHDASNSYIRSSGTGDLIIEQRNDDKDIVFNCDDGSGGITEYFRFDGSTTSMVASKNITFLDNFRATFGSGADMAIYHNSASSNGIIENFTNDLIIQNNASDEDIVFKCDDGSGGVTEYFRVDGSSEISLFSKNIRLGDNVQLQFGGGTDLQISHDATDSYIQNATGNLKIFQNANDKDITFYNDDGSGGTTAYFFLDGSQAGGGNVYVKYPDNSRITLGDGSDVYFYHNGTDSFLWNLTGDLKILNSSDDKDIIFQCDDGGGNLTDYIRIDGSEVRTLFSVNAEFSDNVKAKFGDSDDLEIYHDNLNTSYIKHKTTGDFRIVSDSTGYIKIMYALENMGVFIPNGAVELYHNNVKKLDTRTTGIRIAGVSEYADNTAAIAGGLTTGDVYRTGDLLKIVH